MKVDLSSYVGRKVAVLGGTGMIGAAVCNRLGELGAMPFAFSRGTGLDLRNRDRTIEVLGQIQADLCICLAGWNGGLKSNLESPSLIYTNNAQIALNAVEACSRHNIPFLGALASCGYPESQDGIVKEKTYLEGMPHESVACHGLAKRAMLQACLFASQQFPAGRFRCVCIPTVAGPGDHFEEGRTKVVGAMIKRMVDAKEANAPSVTCWGSGKPLRDLLYVKDAAELILASALAEWDGQHPLNLSVGQEFSIKQIAEAAAEAAGYEGEIKFDPTKPDGQFRKRLESKRAKKVLGAFKPTPFDEWMGLTVKAYKSKFPAGKVEVLV